MAAPGPSAAASGVSPSLRKILATGLVALVVMVVAYMLPGDVVQAHAVRLSNSTMLPGGVARRHNQWFAPRISGDATGPPQFDCNVVASAFHPNITDAELSSYRFNHLRRMAYTHDRSCYEEHLDQFSKAFLLRRRSTGGRHYNLHTPKSGGTSLCQAVLQDGFKSPNGACHNKPGCAAWCCCSLDRPKMECDVLSGKYGRYDFVGNENYLDHPMCLEDRLYSATIRNPISRTISHFEHYLDFVVHHAINGIREEYNGKQIIPNQWWGDRHDSQGETARRINLIQSNYMTWSLIAGLHEEAARYQAGTGATDLEDAIDVIGNFDFLIGMDKNVSSTCTANTLTMMGLKNTTLGHETLNLHRGRGEGEDNYQFYYRRDKYAQLNDLDVVLYGQVVEFIRADCDFFAGIVEAAAGGSSGLSALQFHNTVSPSAMQIGQLKVKAGGGIVVSGKLGRGGSSMLTIP